MSDSKEPTEWDQAQKLFEYVQRNGEKQADICLMNPNGCGNTLPAALIPVLRSALRELVMGRDPVVVRGDLPLSIDQASWVMESSPDVTQLMLATGKLEARTNRHGSAAIRLRDARKICEELQTLSRRSSEIVSNLGTSVAIASDGSAILAGDPGEGRHGAVFVYAPVDDGW